MRAHDEIMHVSAIFVLCFFPPSFSFRFDSFRFVFFFFPRLSLIFCVTVVLRGTMVNRKDQRLLVKMVKYIGSYVCHRPY